MSEKKETTKCSKCRDTFIVSSTEQLKEDWVCGECKDNLLSEAKLLLE